MKLIKWKLTRTKLVLGLLTIISLTILATRISIAKKPVVNSLTEYNAQSLVQYNGTDISQPVLLALDGYVYDVSPGRNEFYAPGMPYHDLVGKDSSHDLHIFGAAIIRHKYQIVGVYNP